MKYPTIFDLVNNIFMKANVNCILIGGFAINNYKLTRQTVDIDFLCTKIDFSKIEILLKEEGYEIKRAEDNFIQLENKQQNLIDIDFMLVNENTFSKIFSSGNKIKIAGIEFTIPSLFHLIALKLHSISSNPLRQITDFPDIIRLIKENNVDIDSNDFQALCHKFGTKEIYEKIKQVF